MSPDLHVLLWPPPAKCALACKIVGPTTWNGYIALKKSLFKTFEQKIEVFKRKKRIYKKTWGGGKETMQDTEQMVRFGG